MTAPTFITARLELIAATAPVARAAASDPAAFGRLLEAEIPPAWPPAVMADVQEYFAKQLESGAVQPGWLCWYAVQKHPRILIGGFGLNGAPDSEGTVTMGYSVVSDFEGRGYASEIVAGLIAWMQTQAGVRRIHATTFERHHASVRVLEKNCFIRKGVSSEDAAASEKDRQGRGRLTLFAREF